MIFTPRITAIVAAIVFVAVLLQLSFFSLTPIFGSVINVFNRIAPFDYTAGYGIYNYNFNYALSGATGTMWARRTSRILGTETRTETRRRRIWSTISPGL